MIVLGNLPSSKYIDGVYTKTTNIIYAPGQLNKVKRELKLLGEPVATRKMSYHYKMAGRDFFLHDAGSIPALTKLYHGEVPRTDFKLASPYAQYVWARAFSSFQHHSTMEWVDTTRTFGKLHRMYFKPTIQPELHTKAARLAKELYYVAGDYPIIDSSGDIYQPWAKYTRSSVLESIANKGVSLYDELLVFSGKPNLPMVRDRLSLERWVAFSEEERIEAVLERVYSDIANEYHFNNVCYAHEELVIMTMLMRAATRCLDEWFSLFIRINFDKIMSEADLGIGEYIQWAESNNEFLKIAQ
jgi:hypothetical protein